MARTVGDNIVENEGRRIIDPWINRTILKKLTSTFNKAPKYHNGLHLKYWLGLICVRWGRHRNGFRSRQTKDIEICGTRREAWLEFNYGLVTEELV